LRRISLLMWIFILGFGAAAVFQLHGALTSEAGFRWWSKDFTNPALALVALGAVIFLAIRESKSDDRMIEAHVRGVVDIALTSKGYYIGAFAYDKPIISEKPPYSTVVLVLHRATLKHILDDPAFKDRLMNADDVPEIDPARGASEALDVVRPLRDAIRRGDKRFALVTCIDPKFVVDAVRADAEAPEEASAPAA
jgi:hypothetical protein